MTDEQGYNGWANRETWAVALYINNDQGWQESVHELVRQGIQEWAETEEFPFDGYHAGVMIRESVEEVLQGDGNGDSPEALTWQRDTLADIGSLYRVDWDEIGAAFLSDVREQDEQ